MIEYEYNLRTTKHKVFYSYWGSEEDMIDMCNVNTLDEVKASLPEGRTLIRRVKAGEIEDA